MSDQSTPVTDDDRAAHEWASTSSASWGPLALAAVRAIRAHVPAPPKSLADELREYAKNYATVSRRSMLRILADRVEAVEVENRENASKADAWKTTAYNLTEFRDEVIDERDEARADATDLGEVNHEIRRERDEARAEVELLAAQIDRLIDEMDKVRNGDWLNEALPDPADVEPWTAWLIEFEGKHYEGRRSPGEYYDYYWSFMKDGAPCSAKDSEVTLVSRLVREVRRVIDRPEDLDTLPEGSVVLDEDGDPWKKIIARDWAYGHDTVISAGRLLHDSPTVTVIHEPEVTT